MPEKIVRYKTGESHEIVKEVGKLVRCRNCDQLENGWCQQFEDFAPEGMSFLGLDFYCGFGREKENDTK